MAFKEKLIRFDKLWIGLVIGVVVPIVTLLIVFLYSFNNYTVPQFLHFLYTMRVMTKLFSLCVIPNLAVFYLFLQYNLNKATKGIVSATFLVAIIIVIIQVAIGAF